MLLHLSGKGSLTVLSKPRSLLYTNLILKRASQSCLLLPPSVPDVSSCPPGHKNQTAPCLQMSLSNNSSVKKRTRPSARSMKTTGSLLTPRTVSTFVLWTLWTQRVSNVSSLCPLGQGVLDRVSFPSYRVALVCFEQQMSNSRNTKSRLCLMFSPSAARLSESDS